MRHLIILCLFGLVISCTNNPSESKKSDPVQVKLVTNFGDIVIELSEITTLHKENFIKQVNDSAYDSLLFHRVIEGFVIQGGDPESKFAQLGESLGNGGLEYRIPAEFDTTLFHKRGAVGTARDSNPERESNAMQFYIVQAGPVADSTIDKNEIRINGWLADHYILHAPENKIWLDSLNWAVENEEYNTYRHAWDTIRSMAKSYDDFERYVIPQKHREVYRTVGGTPQLDQNYTVFAEVISGMAVVDSIASLERDPRNRPLIDARILSAEIIQ